MLLAALALPPVPVDAAVVDPTALVEAARHHRVLGAVADYLTATGAPAELLEPVQQARQAERLDAMRVEAVLHEASIILTDAGIVHATYKGPALAQLYYGDPTARWSADADVLIAERDLVTADKALRDKGFGAPYGVDHAHTHGHGEVEYFSQHGRSLDLHWQLLRERRIRSAFALDTDAILARRQRQALTAGSVDVLDPADMLLAVAAHACFDGAYRLGWLVDLRRLLASGRIDPTTLRARTQDSGLGLVLRVMLDRAARSIGGVDVPDWLPRVTWSRGLDLFTRARPVAGGHQQALRGGVIYRSTRRTSAASTLALAQALWYDVAVPLRTDPQHRWRQRRGSRDATMTDGHGG